jgi:hypothetical protein
VLRNKTALHQQPIGEIHNTHRVLVPSRPFKKQFSRPTKQCAFSRLQGRYAANRRSPFVENCGNQRLANRGRNPAGDRP